MNARASVSSEAEDPELYAQKENIMASLETNMPGTPVPTNPPILLNDEHRVMEGLGKVPPPIQNLQGMSPEERQACSEFLSRIKGNQSTAA